ncbi:aminotransferase class V-fold PLP-dependent enzyme [Brumimicrobium glaciale]|uniref:Aminotransferase class V-fold PLP-dependent enzyme n=1 Tax=Brumimicrobium glaciale TaxID=200475 RepID=A0A4Q4KQE3_9FLAO|nr:aminotransferase class V-fold PLP-dependent enzyme [Brumimicrobium glaciale]RYM35750.1 aminotransferase class V-fold PLP-dependent enzyme [Brumimicrobium glaciale]
MEEALAVFQSIASELLADEKVNSVVDYIPADQLFDKLDLSLIDQPIDDETHLRKLKELVMATPRTATNAFFNQLYGGRNEKAVLGELLAVLLNNSMYTYKAAGAQVGVEKIVLRKVCEIIGWNENADGTFATGGSMTNFMSMLMARDAFNSKIRFEGVQQKMTVYTSIESHYSIPKNASFAGIGRNNVRYIPVNKVGEMIPADLDTAIAKDIADGFHPVMVNATAGTTVLGAFDNVEAINEVCKKYNVWMHVDGAYCGSVIFSEKYKHHLKGLENVDSFSFNAHKMIGTPLTCSLIVVKDKKNLRNSFANEAEYLFQSDEDDFNPGKTSLQCGRRNDALKFWTLWKSVGTKGLEKIVDHQFDLADTARDYVRNHPDYKLYSFEDSISVCFNYKNISAKDICAKLYEHAELMVGYGAFQEDEFIRFVTINAQNSNEDILLFFKKLEGFVAEHFNELKIEKLGIN